MKKIIKGNSIRPDAQAFDEIRVFTVPRYKQSGLSGDEWRISATVQFLRNGVVKHEWGCSSVEYAAYLMGAKFVEAQDGGLGYFASEDDFCDQEGCKEKAEIFLKKKHDFCKEGHKTETTRGGLDGEIRQFCKEHNVRGDCGLDDSDRNYEEVSK